LFAFVAACCVGLKDVDGSAKTGCGFDEERYEPMAGSMSGDLASEVV